MFLIQRDEGMWINLEWIWLVLDKANNLHLDYQVPEVLSLA
jgi:hypothetical protein